MESKIKILLSYLFDRVAKTTSLHEQQGDLPSVLRSELSLNLYLQSVRD